jgi:D-glycerate 3-kinase
VYLGRAARQRMARTRHPLWLTRGVPGTHDVALLRATLRALRRASAAQPAYLPRFDKGHDTRRPPSRWPRVIAAPALIVLEGWCLGLPPQAAAQLTRPLNTLERREDSDGRWRCAVNAALAAYAPLWNALDLRILLHAPSFAAACRWRAQAEVALHARAAPRAMDAAQLRRFMQHYQRLNEHALATLPRWADVCVDLNAARGVRALRLARRLRGRVLQGTGSTTTVVP